MPVHPLITVIIPTLNNCPVLKRVLQSLLLQQRVENDFEVIVLDDGSEDDTWRMVEEIAAVSAVPIRYEWQTNRGVSAARNRAVTLAAGNYSLLLGDDIIPASDLIWQHLSAHERYRHGRNIVVGRVTWPDGMPVSSFMEWLDQTEFQFAYKHITRTEDIDFRYFYACNASLLTESLRRNPFQETLPYLFEDTELACRLFENGHRFFFNPEAIGYHEHPREFTTFEKRQYLAGRSLWTAFQINPRLAKHIPMPRRRPMRRLRTVLRGIALPIFSPSGGRRIREKFWRGRLNLALTRGYLAARRAETRGAGASLPAARRIR